MTNSDGRLETDNCPEAAFDTLGKPNSIELTINTGETTVRNNLTSYVLSVRDSGLGAAIENFTCYEVFFASY